MRVVPAVDSKPFVEWSIADVWSALVHAPFLGGVGTVALGLLIIFGLIFIFR